jgi:glycosyltransferase involved in cell wall biosynthesis
MTTIDNDIFNKGNKLCFLDIQSTVSIKQLVTNKLDIVHTFYPINLTASFLFPFFRAHNIPVICSHHCDPSQVKIFKPFDNIMYEILKFYHLQFNSSFVSLNLAPTITKENSNFINDLKIIPSGINTKVFNYKNIDFQQKCKCKLLVYVGRLSPEKNCDKMLGFFEKLIKNPEYNEYKLLVIGDGPSKIELENKKIPNVIFVGYVKHEKVAEYYKKAQAFVTFSLSETFGFTNIEALSCATPIIYPKCKVFDTYYKKDFALTRFNVNDYESFEIAVKNTYNNDEIQKKAIEYCKDKDWKSTTKKIVDIYYKQIQKNYRVDSLPVTLKDM